MEEQLNELLTKHVGAGWVLHLFSKNKEIRAINNVFSMPFTTLSSSIMFEVMKVGKYIIVSSRSGFRNSDGLVIPADERHDDHTTVVERRNDHISYVKSFINFANSSTITHVYTFSESSGWSRVNSLHHGKYVFSGNSLMKPLINKIKKAKALNELGNSININMVFHGLPGTGKTKLATDLAVSLFKDIYIIDPRNIGDLGSIKRDSVLLIEELDKMLSPNGEFFNPDSDNIGQLLQLLDGATRPRNAVIIITCNDIKLLMRNPILSRPGRNTDIVEFGYVNQIQCRSLCQSLYPADTPNQSIDVSVNELWNSVKDLNVTIAELSTYVGDCAISDVPYESMINDVVAGIKRIKSLTSNSYKLNHYY